MNVLMDMCTHVFIAKYFHHRGMKKCIKYIGMLYTPLHWKKDHIYNQCMETIVCLVNYHTSPGKARRMNTSQGRTGSIL